MIKVTIDSFHKVDSPFVDEYQGELSIHQDDGSISKKEFRTFWDELPEEGLMVSDGFLLKDEEVVGYIFQEG